MTDWGWGMIVSPGLFFPEREDMQALFVQTVTNIEIEIGSYCNRRCGFCPNSFIDRISERRLMDDALFDGIILQLGAMGWRGTIRFHRYNEPLADRDYLLRRLDTCHALAPCASVLLQTNGDYLDRSYLEAIYDAGCRTSSARPTSRKGCRMTMPKPSRPSRVGCDVWRFHSNG